MTYSGQDPPEESNLGHSERVLFLFLTFVHHCVSHPNDVSFLVYVTLYKSHDIVFEVWIAEVFSEVLGLFSEFSIDVELADAHTDLSTTYIGTNDS